MLTEQQKARIVELAQRCENNLSWAAQAPVWHVTQSRSYINFRRRMAAERSAEAFRIAQEASRHA